MRKSSLTIAFLVCILTNSFAQYGLYLIDSAYCSFCRGDTGETIKYLQGYSEKYPDNANTLLVNHRLGEFFIEAKDYPSALALLSSSLTLEPKIGFISKETDGCKLFNRNDFSSAKADICVTLSRLYQQLGDKVGALEYL